MKSEEIIKKMLDRNSSERKNAEKMIGKKVEKMTPKQMALAAECISMFNIQIVD